jgi:hypothetical protein
MGEHPTGEWGRVLVVIADPLAWVGGLVWAEPASAGSAHRVSSNGSRSTRERARRRRCEDRDRGGKSDEDELRLGIEPP